MVSYAKSLKEAGLDEQIVLDALMGKGLTLNLAMTVVIAVF